MNKIDRDYLIYSAARAGGVEIFQRIPKLLTNPWENLETLNIIDDAFTRLKGKELNNNSKISRKICRKFTVLLSKKKIPKGSAVLARIVEKLSITLKGVKFTRGLWIKLSCNRKAFIRRRFVRLLRENLTQTEADILLGISEDMDDFEILRHIILSNPAIELPEKVIDYTAEYDDFGFILSRAMAHNIYKRGIKAFAKYYQNSPVRSIYALGFSGRKDLASELHKIIKDNQIDEKEQKAALWAFASLNLKNDLFNLLPELKETL